MYSIGIGAHGPSMSPVLQNALGTHRPPFRHFIVTLMQQMRPFPLHLGEFLDARPTQAVLFTQTPRVIFPFILKVHFWAVVIVQNRRRNAVMVKNLITAVLGFEEYCWLGRDEVDQRGKAPWSNICRLVPLNTTEWWWGNWSHQKSGDHLLLEEISFLVA